MSDTPTIFHSDIGEEIIYNWTCPDCGSHNEQHEEIDIDDLLECESCGKETIVIYDL